MVDKVLTVEILPSFVSFRHIIIETCGLKFIVCSQNKLFSWKLAEI